MTSLFIAFRNVFSSSGLVEHGPYDHSYNGVRGDFPTLLLAIIAKDDVAVFCYIMELGGCLEYNHFIEMIDKKSTAIVRQLDSINRVFEDGQTEPQFELTPEQKRNLLTHAERHSTRFFNTMKEWSDYGNKDVVPWELKKWKDF